MVRRECDCANDRSRESYLLHIPVKMSVSSLVRISFKRSKLLSSWKLFRKILRLTDVKTVEAHTLSEEDTASGKGRSQILNLLTVDTGTIAGLATHVWGASNAFIDREWPAFLAHNSMHRSCIPVPDVWRERIRWHCMYTPERTNLDLRLAKILS